MEENYKNSELMVESLIKNGLRMSYEEKNRSFARKSDFFAEKFVHFIFLL